MGTNVLRPVRSLSSTTVYRVNELGIIYADGVPVKEVEIDRRLMVLLTPRFTTSQLIAKGYDREPFIGLMWLLHGMMSEQDTRTREIIEDLFLLNISDYDPDRMLPFLERQWFRSATRVVGTIGAGIGIVKLVATGVGIPVAAAVVNTGIVLSGASVLAGAATTWADGNTAKAITNALIEGGLIVVGARNVTAAGRATKTISRTAANASRVRQAANVVYLITLYEVESTAYKSLLKGLAEFFTEVIRGGHGVSNTRRAARNLTITEEDLDFFLSLRFAEIGGR